MTAEIKLDFDTNIQTGLAKFQQGYIDLAGSWRDKYGKNIVCRR